MQRMLKDGRRLRTKARVGGARKEERREEGRGGDGGGTRKDQAGRILEGTLPRR